MKGLGSESPLNDQQRIAVESKATRLLINAGPGTGKTHTLTARIAHQLSNGVSGYRVLALTFTRKAAQEMRGRVEDEAGGDAFKITFGTFHAVCLKMIQQWARTLGYINSDITVYDDIDQARIIKEIAARYAHGADEKKLATGALEAMASAPCLVADGMVQWVIGEYHTTLKCHNAVDYQMLISEATRLLETSPEALCHYQNQWKNIFVDEYQDTDSQQQRWLDLLLAGDGSELTAVGDVDQCLYGWRNADTKIMLGFVDRYPGAEVVCLTTNYRSTRNIVGQCQALVQHNESRIVGPAAESAIGGDVGPPVSVVVSETQESQTENIANRVEFLAENDGIPFGEMAILARTNYQLSPIALALERRGIPYQVVTPLDVWRSTAVKRVMDVFRLALNQFDNVACKNLLMFPIKIVDDIDLQKLICDATSTGLALSHRMSWPDVAVGQYQSLKADSMSRLLGLVASLRESVDTMQAKDAALLVVDAWKHDLKDDEMEHLERWVLSWIPFFGTVPRFLGWAATRLVEDSVKSESDTVKIMTVHAAKGLEFDAVFMVDCLEGKFPMTRHGTDVEEERRVFYVGMSRAKRWLSLTYPENIFRGRGDKMKAFPTQPSRFLEEIKA